MIWLNGGWSGTLNHLPGSLIPPLYFEKPKNYALLKYYPSTLLFFFKSLYSHSTSLSSFIFNMIKSSLSYKQTNKQASKNTSLDPRLTHHFQYLYFLPHKFLKRIFLYFWLFLALCSLCKLSKHGLNCHQFTYSTRFQITFLFIFLNNILCLKSYYKICTRGFQGKKFFFRMFTVAFL